MTRDRTGQTYEIGRQLVDLCNQGRHLDAVNQLYAEDVVSVEPCGDDTMPRQMQGIEAVRGKNQWWLDNHEVHSGVTEGPYPHDDRFITHMKYEVTIKIGPKAGQRMRFQEAGLYTVADGKIVREEFFYHMEG